MLAFTPADAQSRGNQGSAPVLIKPELNDTRLNQPWKKKLHGEQMAPVNLARSEYYNPLSHFNCTVTSGFCMYEMHDTTYDTLIVGSLSFIVVSNIKVRTHCIIDGFINWLVDSLYIEKCNVTVTSYVRLAIVLVS